MDVVLIFCLGICLGVYLGCCFERNRKKADGILWVDRTDPDDGPYIYLELNKEPYDIATKYYVKFQVKNKK